MSKSDPAIRKRVEAGNAARRQRTTRPEAAAFLEEKQKFDDLVERVADEVNDIKVECDHDDLIFPSASEIVEELVGSDEFWAKLRRVLEGVK